jgi:hypothetical protein
MSQEERFGTRDRTYSAWHRRLSTRRFIGIENAQLLAMIDLDASLYVEYDDGTKEPLILIETARDVGQIYKTATVTCKLAQRANLPCYVLLYKLSQTLNPADKNWYDIESFRVRRLYPCPENGWRVVSPRDWARALLEIRLWKAKQIDSILDIASN